MENHKPSCKKIKLIEGEKDVEEDIHMEKDIVLREMSSMMRRRRRKKKMSCTWTSISPYISFNNVDADEYIEFMMELLHLYNEMKLLHILAEAEEKNEEEADE